MVKLVVEQEYCSKSEVIVGDDGRFKVLKQVNEKEALEFLDLTTEINKGAYEVTVEHFGDGTVNLVYTFLKPYKRGTGVNIYTVVGISED